MKNINNIFLGSSNSLRDAKNSVAIIYYLYLILIAAVQVLFSLGKPEQQIIWNYAPIVMIVAFVSLLTHFKFPKQTFLANSILVFIILVALKFNIIYKNTFSPVQYLMTIAFCITVVYFYDYRKSFIIPLLFVLLDIGELMFMQDLRYSGFTERIDANLERITYTAISLYFYIFVLSNFFSTKLTELISKHREKEGKIAQARTEEQKSLHRLKSEYKAIEEFVTINSHKVRAPISRIQGLLSLHQSNLDDDSDSSGDIEGMNLQEELKNSLAELRTELEAFEKTIKNAENERSTSYEALLSEEDTLDDDMEQFADDENEQQLFS